MLQEGADLLVNQTVLFIVRRKHVVVELDRGLFITVRKLRLLQVKSRFTHLIMLDFIIIKIINFLSKLNHARILTLSDYAFCFKDLFSRENLKYSEFYN